MGNSEFHETVLRIIARTLDTTDHKGQVYTFSRCDRSEVFSQAHRPVGPNEQSIRSQSSSKIVT